MENIQQTGLLIAPPSPTDYIMGAETKIPVIERILSGDWHAYLPTNEAQHIIGYDTMSCVTFSALNCIEIQINWLIQNGKVPAPVLKAITDLGFIDANGFFNASDRFTAIMSGTTKNGNYLHKVAESIRKDGLLPDKDFAFGGASWEEYHNPANITEEMKTKAKEIFKYFSFQYEWIFFNQENDLDGGEVEKLEQALKSAPAQVGLPVPAVHAISCVGMARNPVKYHLFDSYNPFHKDGDEAVYNLNFAMKLFVDVLPQETMLKHIIIGKEQYVIGKDGKAYHIYNVAALKALQDLGVISGSPEVVSAPISDSGKEIVVLERE